MIDHSTMLALLFMAGAVAMLATFGMGLSKLGLVPGLFAFMLTAATLVVFWPLGLLFFIVICFVAFADPRYA